MRSGSRESLSLTLALVGALASLLLNSPFLALASFVPRSLA